MVEVFTLKLGSSYVSSVGMVLVIERCCILIMLRRDSILYSCFKVCCNPLGFSFFSYA